VERDGETLREDGERVSLTERDGVAGRNASWIRELRSLVSLLALREGDIVLPVGTVCRWTLEAVERAGEYRLG